MTSKLESYLSKELYTRFGQYSVRQNYRPFWLDGLELDFYIDELILAAEVQGEQHYSFVEFFHRNQEGFEAQKKRDIEKSIICRNHGIDLIEIHTEKDADLFVLLVRERSNIQPIEIPKGLGIFKKHNKFERDAIKTYNKALKKLSLHEQGAFPASEHELEVWKKIVKKGVKVKGVRRW